jgi:hypothetical protein
MRVCIAAESSGKMHDLLQIARPSAKNAHGAMTESCGRFGRIVPTGRHSPDSVTAMEAD